MKIETIKTSSRSNVCDGGVGAQGHPRVFLEIAPDKKQTTCPYCSKVFVLVAARKAA